VAAAGEAPEVDEAAAFGAVVVVEVKAFSFERATGYLIEA
jgi:hypothetical protein